MDKTSVEKFALAVTRGVGSPMSIVIHTILFAACFIAAFGGWVLWETLLLVLTTIVSLEAIYLAIFIQMTINYTTKELEEIGEDIDEIQEDVDEIQEDVGEIQEDVDELQEDVEDISEDVEEMTEEEKVEEETEEHRKKEQRDVLATIKNDLQKLLTDVEKLKASQ